MDDDFIQKFEELWNQAKEILKELWKKLKEFIGDLTALIPKEEVKVRDSTLPKIIKCIGQPLRGYSARPRARTRNSC